ncbi:MAG: hypothetical protein ACP5HC_06485 [Caldisericum sp.]
MERREHLKLWLLYLVVGLLVLFSAIHTGRTTTNVQNFTIGIPKEKIEILKNLLKP